MATLQFCLASSFCCFLPQNALAKGCSRQVSQEPLERFFPESFDFPRSGPVVWLHAVSVGESKALSTLTPHIRKAHPDAFILVTTVTETGQEQAKKSVPEADAFCYLPFDFPWIMSKFVKRIKPSLLILVEGDFWLNMLREVKKSGSKVALVNGKLSERSYKRYLLIKPFAHAVFSCIDLFCVQSETYRERFVNLGVPMQSIHVTDNLKFDISTPDLNGNYLREQLGLKPKDFVVTVGSTHPGEEALILEQLVPLQKEFPNLKLLVVPRHPERFKQVEKILHTRKCSYSLLSNLTDQHRSVILVDQMGVLPSCYHISQLSIVGGSFVPDIGGHDVFEPSKMGVPVLFGPHMETQHELLDVLSKANVGKQLPANHLAAAVEKYLTDEELLKEESARGIKLAKKIAGASERTWSFLTSNFPV